MSTSTAAPLAPRACGYGPRLQPAFVTTRWSVVLAAGASDTIHARDALAKLCETYWYPLYAYVRQRGYAPHDAQDLTQEFFARLLERNSLRAITREKGKFRSFLLTAFNHFLVDEWKKARAQKRGGGQLISLDASDAETRFGREPVDMMTPEKLFDQNWALALLESVLDQLQREYVAEGKGALFKELKPALAGARDAVPYAALAVRLSIAENTVKTSVHRLRKRYRELLRLNVAHTVATANEVEEELRTLFRVLAAS
jgi:RNA polymerase sigma factor (sigma-70 family)